MSNIKVKSVQKVFFLKMLVRVSGRYFRLGRTALSPNHGLNGISPKLLAAGTVWCRSVSYKRSGMFHYVLAKILFALDALCSQISLMILFLIHFSCRFAVR